MRQDGTSEPRAVATRLNSEPELRFLRSETGGAAQTNAHASSVFRSDASSGLVNTPKQTSALPVSVLYQHKRVVLVQGDSGPGLWTRPPAEAPLGHTGTPSAWTVFVLSAVFRRR